MPTMIHRGSFTKTLAENPRGVKILFMHDMERPIGKPTSLFEGDTGLELTASISRTDDGIRAMTLLRDEVIDALSIGFDPIKFDLEIIDDVQFRHIREVKLHEISLVTLGADAMARIQEVNSAFTVKTPETFGLQLPNRLYEDDETKAKRFTVEITRYAREGNLTIEKLTDLTESFGYSQPPTSSEPETTEPVTDVERLYDDAAMQVAAMMLDD